MFINSFAVVIFSGAGRALEISSPKFSIKAPSPALQNKRFLNKKSPTRHRVLWVKSYSLVNIQYLIILVVVICRSACSADAGSTFVSELRVDFYYAELFTMQSKVAFLLSHQ